MKNILYGFSFCILTLSCTTQQKVVQVAPQIQEVQNPDERVLKRKVAISRFSNETQYAKGIFYDKENDPIGKQALDILSAKLVASGKFILLEREGLEQIEDELEMSGKEALKKVGADFLIIGSVTQFGRKNVGDVNAFSRTKSQTVEAGVSLRLVDVSTGQIIYSEEALGEASTTNKTVMGYGERTGYDASLSDKAISAAISKLTENVINNCLEKPWRSYFLNYDDDGILISGGESQGLEIDDLFEVVKIGKEVENPQTGMMMELPGKVVGKVKVDFIGGEGTQNEYSMVSFTNGNIEKEALSTYYIREIKK